MATLKVTVHEARDLPIMDRATGLADPYVILRLDDMEYTTEIARRTRHPVWNSSYRFDTPDLLVLQEDPLEVRVYDHDIISRDDIVGLVVLDCNSIMHAQNPFITGWFPLLDTSAGMRGDIRLTIRLKFHAADNPLMPILPERYIQRLRVQGGERLDKADDRAAFDGAGGAMLSGGPSGSAGSAEKSSGQYRWSKSTPPQRRGVATGVVETASGVSEESSPVLDGGEGRQGLGTSHPLPSSARGGGTPLSPAGVPVAPNVLPFIAMEQGLTRLAPTRIEHPTLSTDEEGVCIFSVWRLDPAVYRVESIYSMLEELIVKADPERSRLTNLRSTRATNEARLTQLYKLSGKVRRQLTRKVVEVRCNAVLGYVEEFDMEPNGMIIRAYGTPCVISRVKQVRFADERRLGKLLRYHQRLFRDAGADSGGVPPPPLSPPLVSGAASSARAGGAPASDSALTLPPSAVTGTNVTTTTGTAPATAAAATTTTTMTITANNTTMSTTTAAAAAGAVTGSLSDPPCTPTVAPGPTGAAPRGLDGSPYSISASDRAGFDAATSPLLPGRQAPHSPTLRPPPRSYQSANNSSQHLVHSTGSGGVAGGGGGGSYSAAPLSHTGSSPQLFAASTYMLGPAAAAAAAAAAALPFGTLSTALYAVRPYFTAAGGAVRAGGGPPAVHAVGFPPHPLAGPASSTATGEGVGGVLDPTSPPTPLHMAVPAAGGGGARTSSTTSVSAGVGVAPVVVPGVYGGAAGGLGVPGSAGLPLGTPVSQSLPGAAGPAVAGGGGGHGGNGAGTANAHPHTRAAVLVLTVKDLPSGCILHMGGHICTRSIKIVSRVKSKQVISQERDAWWMELREELRANARAFHCNAILGYEEDTQYYEDVVLLSLSGTAVILDPSFLSCRAGADFLYRRAKDRAEHRRNCGILHMYHGPHRKALSAEMGELLHHNMCNICHEKPVPDVLLASCALPVDVSCEGPPRLVQVAVSKPKRVSKGVELATAVSQAIPFIEYALHKQLLFNLRLMGLNACFAMRVSISIGPDCIAGVLTGTGCQLRGLPRPSYPRLELIDPLIESKEAVVRLRDVVARYKRGRRHWGGASNGRSSSSRSSSRSSGATRSGSTSSSSTTSSHGGGRGGDGKASSTDSSVHHAARRRGAPASHGYPRTRPTRTRDVPGSGGGSGRDPRGAVGVSQGRPTSPPTIGAGLGAGGNGLCPPPDSSTPAGARHRRGGRPRAHRRRPRRDRRRPRHRRRGHGGDDTGSVGGARSTTSSLTLTGSAYTRGSSASGSSAESRGSRGSLSSRSGNGRGPARRAVSGRSSASWISSASSADLGIHRRSHETPPVGRPHLGDYVVKVDDEEEADMMLGMVGATTFEDSLLLTLPYVPDVANLFDWQERVSITQRFAITDPRGTSGGGQGQPGTGDGVGEAAVVGTAAGLRGGGGGGGGVGRGFVSSAVGYALRGAGGGPVGSGGGGAGGLGGGADISGGGGGGYYASLTGSTAGGPPPLTTRLLSNCCAEAKRSFVHTACRMALRHTGTQTIRIVQFRLTATIDAHSKELQLRLEGYLLGCGAQGRTRLLTLEDAAFWQSLRHQATQNALIAVSQQQQQQQQSWSNLQRHNSGLVNPWTGSMDGVGLTQLASVSDVQGASATVAAVAAVVAAAAEGASSTASNSDDADRAAAAAAGKSEDGAEAYLLTNNMGRGTSTGGVDASSFPDAPLTRYPNAGSRFPSLGVPTLASFVPPPPPPPPTTALDGVVAPHVNALALAAAAVAQCSCRGPPTPSQSPEYVSYHLHRQLFIACTAPFSFPYVFDTDGAVPLEVWSGGPTPEQAAESVADAARLAGARGSRRSAGGGGGGGRLSSEVGGAASVGAASTSAAAAAAAAASGTATAAAGSFGSRGDTGVGSSMSGGGGAGAGRGAVVRVVDSTGPRADVDGVRSYTDYHESRRARPLHAFRRRWLSFLNAASNSLRALVERTTMDPAVAMVGSGYGGSLARYENRNNSAPIISSSGGGGGAERTRSSFDGGRSNLGGSMEGAPGAYFHQLASDLRLDRPTERVPRDLARLDDLVPGVFLTPLDYVPGHAIVRYISRLSQHFIRESADVDGSGALALFHERVELEMASSVQGFVRLLGGNAVLKYRVTYHEGWDAESSSTALVFATVTGDVAQVTDTPHPALVQATVASDATDRSTGAAAASNGGGGGRVAGGGRTFHLQRQRQPAGVPRQGGGRRRRTTALTPDGSSSADDDSDSFV